MNRLISKKDSLLFFALIIFCLLFFNPSGQLYASEESAETNVKNPFSDYRVEKDKVKEKKEEVITVENKREEPSFSWQGLISKEEKTIILISSNERSYFLQKGKKINGYKIVNIAIDKIRLKKDGYIYYLTMGRDQDGL